MKRLLIRGIAPVFALIVLLGAAACGGQPAPQSTATPAVSAATPIIVPTTLPRTPMATAPPAATPTSLPVLKVGLDAANPPWCSADGRGTLVGIDVDLLNTLGREMGVRFEAVNLPPHLLAPELAARRVDLIAGGLISTSVRAQSMSLSRPYLVQDQAIVVSAMSAYSGTAALNGRTVGVQIGSVAVAEARKAGGKVTLYDDLAIALAALARGEVQAALGDRAIVADLLRQQPGLGLRLAGSAGAGQPVALGVARENSALLSRINAALSALAQRGELSILERRWLQ